MCSLVLHLWKYVFLVIQLVIWFKYSHSVCARAYSAWMGPLPATCTVSGRHARGFIAQNPLESCLFAQKSPCWGRKRQPLYIYAGNSFLLPTASSLHHSEAEAEASEAVRHGGRLRRRWTTRVVDVRVKQHRRMVSLFSPLYAGCLSMEEGYSRLSHWTTLTLLIWTCWAVTAKGGICQAYLVIMQLLVLGMRESSQRAWCIHATLLRNTRSVMASIWCQWGTQRNGKRCTAFLFIHPYTPK